MKTPHCLIIGGTRGIGLALTRLLASEGQGVTVVARRVPEAAKRDSYLYELLALIDAIRDGRARERKLAEKELVTRLRSKDHGSRDNGKS